MRKNSETDRINSVRIIKDRDLICMIMCRIRIRRNTSLLIGFFYGQIYDNLFLYAFSQKKSEPYPVI